MNNSRETTTNNENQTMNNATNMESTNMLGDSKSIITDTSLDGANLPPQFNQEDINVIRNIFGNEPRFCVITGDKKPTYNGWTENPFTLDEVILRNKEKHSYHCKNYTKTFSIIGKGIGFLNGNGYMSIDFDGHNAWELIKEIGLGELAEVQTLTWSSRKDHRKQIMVKIPTHRLKDFENLGTTRIDNFGNIKKVEKEQLEFRYKGSQSTLPPSPHPDTGKYCFLNANEPLELSDEQCDRILEVHKRHLTKTDKNGKKTYGEKTIKGKYAKLTEEEIQKAENSLIELLADLQYSIPNEKHYTAVKETYCALYHSKEGERNDLLNLGSGDIAQLVNEEGLDDKNTFLNDLNIRNNYDDCESNIVKILYDACINNKLADKTINNEFYSTVNSSWNFYTADGNKRSDRPLSGKELETAKNQYKERVQPQNVLAEIITEFEDKLYFSNITNCWYIYTSNYFQKTGEIVTEKILDEKYSLVAEKWANFYRYEPLSYQMSNTNVEALYKLTRRKLCLTNEREKEKEDKILKSQQRYLPLKNGIFDTWEKELKPHSPKFYNHYILNYDYDPEAKCPTILNFLEESLENEGELKLVQACVRAILFSRYDLQFFLEIIGKKGTGKSTFTNLVIDLIGKENHYSTSLELLEERFAFHDYHDKKLVVIPEATQYNKRANNFLNITGNGSITVQVKKEQARGSKVFQGCVIVNGNERIRASDTAKAIERRRRHIEFNKRPQNPDPKLREKFNLELSGFLNWLLEMDNETMEDIIKFPEKYCKGYSERMKEDELNENPFASYVNDYIVYDPEVKTSSEELYEHYSRKMMENFQSTKINNTSKFIKTLKGLLEEYKVPFEEAQNIKYKDKQRCRGLQNIRLRLPCDTDKLGIIDEFNQK